MGVKCLALPARSPNLNAFSERWVRTVREECLSKLILIGEASLRRALTQFTEHYHAERNHQGKGNLLLFPSDESRRANADRQYSVVSASAASSSITTSGLHEFLDHSPVLSISDVSIP